MRRGRGKLADGVAVVPGELVRRSFDGKQLLTIRLAGGGGWNVNGTISGYSPACGEWSWYHIDAMVSLITAIDWNLQHRLSSGTTHERLSTWLTELVDM